MDDRLRQANQKSNAARAKVIVAMTIGEYLKKNPEGARKAAARLSIYPRLVYIFKKGR